MELITLISIFLACSIIILLVLHYHIHHDKKGRVINKIPGPPTLPIVGNLFSILLRPDDGLWSFGLMVAKKYGSVCRFWVFNQAVVYISDPDDLKIVLRSTVNIEKSLGYCLLHPWLNAGLLTSTGKKWQQRRKIINTAFDYDALAEFYDKAALKTKNLVQDLRAEAGTGGITKELYPITNSLTLEIISEIILGTLVENNYVSLKKYYDAVHDFGKMLMYRVARLWLYDSRVFSMTSKSHELSKIVNTLHGFTANIIKQRKQYHHETEGKYLNTKNTHEDGNTEKYPKKKLALLDCLIAASKKNKEIDDAGIQEEVDTFVFAGHGSVSTTLLFAIKLLAEHKDIQTTAREEINQVLIKTNQEMTQTAVQQCCYLERCIKETLRLYPTVPLIARNITKDIKLKNYSIPAGTDLAIHVFNTHRNSHYWPNPEVFDPDRFSVKNSTGRHSHAYIPFSAGPRNCIGQKFAMLEMKTIMAGILQNFHLDTVDSPDNDNQLTHVMTLNWSKPVHVKFIPILKA